MATDNDDAGKAKTPAKPVLSPGGVMVMKNHGAIRNSRHVFWEAGYVTNDPAEVALIIRTGAVVEQG